MFTGIIEGSGHIIAIRPDGAGRKITVESEFPLDGVKIGDSIATNGACLTATRLSGMRFDADLSPETVQRTAFAELRAGDRVNLERAMRLSDRLDGHLVSGHIDGAGRIRDRRQDASAIRIIISVPPDLSRYMIEKGSVAVDGVSLTINAVTDDSFEVSIIPHTASLTTVGVKRPGATVNIETDMIGKYVERFLMHPKPGAAGQTAHSALKSGMQSDNGNGLSREMLGKFGFIS